jgi:hypothetical protein
MIMELLKPALFQAVLCDEESSASFSIHKTYKWQHMGVYDDEDLAGTICSILALYCFRCIA